MSDEQQYAELKKVLRAALISNNRNGVSVHELERMYREQEGRKIPLLGHGTTLGLLNSMADTVYTKWDGRQMLVFPVDTESTRHISDLVAGQNIQKPRGRRSASHKYHRGRDDFGRDSNRIKNTPAPRLDSMTKSPRYDSTKKPPRSTGKQNASNYSYTSSYKKYADTSYMSSRFNRDDENSHFNTDLSSEYTQTNLTSQNKTNGNYRKQYDDNRNEQTFDSYRKSIDSADKHSNENGHDEKDGSSTGININCQLLLFDEHNIEFDDLPRTKFEEQFNTGQRFRIFLSQIHSPYKFWFHLQEDIDNIETLMNAMDHFYHDDQDMISKSPIPENYCQLGRICAALYDSQWHRAEIIDVFDISVKVFYVDYGTVGEVEKKDVRFLHKRFAQDPIFAHRGCLDKCKPNNGIWTLETMEAFTQRLIEFFSIAIMAKVTNVNIEEKTLYLDLIDTTGPIDLTISDWLIESNFAYPTKKLLFDFQKRHYNEVYPSFARLESGTYPSFQDMKRMLEEGFDFLEYEDTIIIPEMYGYETIE